MTIVAKETVAMVDGVRPAVERMTDGMKDAEDEADKLKSALRFTAGGSKSTSARPGASDAGRRFGGGGDDPETSILDRLPSQQDLIDQIQDTTFGKYLDKYAELFVEQLTKGSRLSPERIKVIQEAIYAEDIGAQDIIRKLTGSAGKKFDFSKFEFELKKMVKAQQDLERAIRQGRAPKSTGTPFASAPKESCAPSSSLSTLLQSGALR